MSFLKNIFGKKASDPINSNADFWEWFSKNEKEFYLVIKENSNVEKNFFRKLGPKLNELKEGYYYLTGMYDDSTAELIISPEGVTKNVVFVEELIADAPQLEHWRFTTLKPEMAIENTQIEMAGYRFDQNNISFQAIEDPNYPDEISIVMLHKKLTDENRQAITHGIYIFLDNYLGELNFIEIIDNLEFKNENEIIGETIRIAKLKDYLKWRQKEFIEKYEGLRGESESDMFSLLKAEMSSGAPMLASINSTLLEWDAKASHPWILAIDINYDGSSNNGLPIQEDNQAFYEMEDELTSLLKDEDGFLHIGRQTAENIRKIYFACNDFRVPSKIAYDFELTYSEKFEVTSEIYKDKYWRSLEKFIPSS